MEPNPISIQISYARHGSVRCMSNASYEQVLTIIGLADKPIIFTGKGEGVNMHTQDGATNYNFDRLKKKDLSITFEYRKGPGQPLMKSRVNTPQTIVSGSWVSVFITSEDSTDNDDNDTAFSLVYQS